MTLKRIVMKVNFMMIKIIDMIQKHQQDMLTSSIDCLRILLKIVDYV